MNKEHPDHHDAELVLRLYELRRDPVMRESREALAKNFLPRSYDDIKPILTNREHPLNAAFRQTRTYWEMVYGMARHGIVDADFLAEMNGEGLLLFAKVQPFLEQIRRDTSPREFRNAEWIATESDVGKQLFASFQERMAKARSAKS